MKEGIDKLARAVKVLKSLPKEIAQISDRSIAFNSIELLNYNREQLQKYGIDANEKKLVYQHPRKSKLKGVYTENYNRFKDRKGGNTKFVDLTLSGDFIKSLKLDHKRLGVFKINAEKYGFDLQTELEWNYGEDILGVTEDNLQKFCNVYLQPDINARVEQLINSI